MADRFIFYSTVERVFKHEPVVRAWKEEQNGKEVVINETVDQGWFVLLKDSKEANYVGHEKPDWKPGDLVQVTMEKWTNDKAKTPKT